MSSTTSRPELIISQYDSTLLRTNSTDSCDENACSKCRLSEEEHRRLKAERRKEQNRASQRRFRAKKENEIRGAADQVACLESKVEDLQRHNAELGRINMTLMAQLTELENHQAYQPDSQSNAGKPTQCQHCHKMITSITTTDVVDYYWPIDDTENQRSGHAGAYLPLFDHELMPFDV